MTGCCPNCGYNLFPELTFLDADQAIYHNGRVQVFTTQQYELFAFLAQQRGRHVSIDRIAFHLWTGANRDEPEHPEMVVRSVISQCRAKLSKLGLAVENIRGAGYRIAFSGEEEASRLRTFRRESAIQKSVA